MKILAFFLYILAGLIILGAILAVVPVEFRIRYGREGEEDLLRLDLLIWPGIRYGLKFFMIDFRTGFWNGIIRFGGEFFKGGEKRAIRTRKKFSPVDFIATILKQWQNITGLYKTVRPALNYLISSIRLKKLTWRTALGTGDPYYTGLAAAMAWSVKGFLITAFCCRLKKSGVPAFSVIPDFTGRHLNITVDCILETRTGHIIFTGARILTALLICGKAGNIFKLVKIPGRRYGYARTSH